MKFIMLQEPLIHVFTPYARIKMFHLVVILTGSLKFFKEGVNMLAEG